MPTNPSSRFETLVELAGPRLLGYIARRIDPPADAADVLAEVFLVAWRRLDSVPAENDEAVRWLYGVARRSLANHRRGHHRRVALAERLRIELDQVQSPPATPEALAIREALATLRDDDYELLTLIAWEGLTSAEAAAVLGIRASAARKRLERARTRLDSALRLRGVRVDNPAPSLVAPAIGS